MADEQLCEAPEVHPHSHLTATPLYRITTLFRARPDLSEADFYRHWYTIHGPLCVPWALHHNFVEYTQYQTSLASRRALTGGKEADFTAGSPFEACADFYVRDYKDYLAAFEHPYYQEVIKPDEDAFVDKGQVEGSGAEELGKLRAISTMGICKSIIRDGRAVVPIPNHVMARWKSYGEARGDEAN